MTASMLAVNFEAIGAAARVVQVSRPIILRGQVLVRVLASAVNPLDLKILAGEAAHACQPLPGILGIDMAGTVEAVAPGITAFRRGDEVYGMAGGIGGLQGSLAEFMAVDADLIAHKPTTLSMREAAAAPLAFITAWEGLCDRAGLHSGQTVLVHGGAGAVGAAAIQIALAAGAVVYATASSSDFPVLERLGATAIDRNLPVEAYLDQHTGGRGFDVVFDSVGGAVLDASFLAVKRFGHIVSALGWGTHALAPLSFRAATYSGIFTLLPLLTGEGRQHHGEILRHATRLAEQGLFAPRVDPRRFTLASVDAAYQVLETRAANGKIVVDVPDAR